MSAIRGTEIDDGINEYVDHLREMTSVFNDYAKEVGLPIVMDATSKIATVRGVSLSSVASFWKREDDNGIVHETQIKTAVDCIHHLHTKDARCGHVVGAMQSGKTTTSLALQWAGPILYLLETNPVYPFYIIGSQMSHEDQTLRELRHFLAYYGDLELRLSASAPVRPEVVPLDPMFMRVPSLTMYRTHVLRGAFEDLLDVPKLDQDLVHRRVGGEQSLKKIAELSRRATAQGFRPLMIIDEPQYGASDRMVTTDSGTNQRECVLTQILNRIEQELVSTRSDHWFIGLSATPFELNDLSRLWEVRQTLTNIYSGFNYFNGRPISEGVDIRPPQTLSLSNFAEEVKVPFLARVNMAAYDLSKRGAFLKHARKVKFVGDQDEYRAGTEEALRDAIYAILDKHKDEKTVGLCIRAFNDNTKTENLIRGLALDESRIAVIRYYGSEVSGMSVKRAIAQRVNRSLPYVLFVTNRARMADAFPAEVRFFMDFAEKASDLNALLQGLLGRACGYGKRSTVVLSDSNAVIVEAYVRSGGAYVHRPSRHSVPVGGYRRGAPTGMIKLRVEADDRIVQEFFSRIDKEVLGAHIIPGSRKLNVVRAKNREKFRTGPILRIAEELGLFEHIESEAVRSALFPQIPVEFRVARREDAVPQTQKPGVTLRYSLDKGGNCRYTFRWSDRGAGARGGAPGRAKGKRDVEQHIEPTIYVEKFDPETGEPINDKGSLELKPGGWRTFMVTFPLMAPVRELQAAEIALPKKLCTYNYLMTPHEQAIRDEAEMKSGPN
jgi:hypothetical protein